MAFPFESTTTIAPGLISSIAALILAISSGVKLPLFATKEITEDVFEEFASVIFDEAENRLHVQKAIMALVMGG